MTICVSVKSRDGVVLGTDSMSQVLASLPDGQQALISSSRNARKLFQIGKKPIGVFTYGAGNLGSRTIHSLVLEFSRKHEGDNVKDIATELAKFVYKEYESVVGEVPLDKKPVLGLYVAGYSADTALSEEWEVRFPFVNEPKEVRSKTDFGSAWRGIELPFARLHNGIDPRILDLLVQRGVPQATLRSVADEKPFMAQVVFDAMPVQDAIDFAVYVLQTTIGFASFEVGSSTCGGDLQIAAITHENGFEWINVPKFKYKG